MRRVFPFGPARARNARASLAAASPTSSGAHMEASASSPARYAAKAAPPGAALGLEADVGIDVGERQTAAGVEDEAELRRQGPAAPGLRRDAVRARRGCRRHRTRRPDRRRSSGLATMLRSRSTSGSASSRPTAASRACKIGESPLADAPDLQVGARRKPDGAVAAGERGLRDRRRLIESEPPAARAHPRDQPVAGLHRPQCPGTPALSRAPRARALATRAIGLMRPPSTGMPE